MVGTGKYFYKPGGAERVFNYRIDGHDLSKFGKNGQELVAIYHVQIYEEYTEWSYPYMFGGPEPPPVKLQELNQLGKSFKRIVAWDHQSLRPCNTRDHLLSDRPRVVYASEDYVSTANEHNSTARQSPKPKGNVRPSPKHKKATQRQSVDDYATTPPQGPATRTRLRTPAKAKRTTVDSTRSDRQPVRIGNISGHVTQNEPRKPIHNRNSRPSPNNNDRRGELPRLDEEREQRSQDENAEQRLQRGMLFSLPSSPARIKRRALQVSESENGDSGGERSDDLVLTPKKRRTVRQFAVTRSPGISEQRHAVSAAEGKRPERRASIEQNEPEQATFSNTGNAIGLSPGTPRQAREIGEPSSNGILPDLGVEEIQPQQQPSENGVRTSPRRRRAPQPRNYVNRVRKRAPPKGLSDLRKRRLQASEVLASSNPFEQTRACCSRWKCFRTVDKTYALAQYKRIMAMNREATKRTLVSLYNNTENVFRFNGRKVCSRFLSKGFGFSATLQSCVKGTEKAPASSSIRASPRETVKKTLADDIICYIEALANNTGDRMPNSNMTNLPLLNRTQVFDQYVKNFAVTDEFGAPRKPPTKPYFMAVWRRSVSDVRTRRHHGFTKCSLCEMFRSEVAKCGAHESSAMEIMQQKREHLQIIAKERRSYYQRRDKAIANPKEFCSFIVDGADQKAYGLPHFAFHSKSDKGHALKVKCIGVLEHLLAKHVTLFTMTEEFPTGANHVVEAMHRVLNTKRLACGKLPPICYIQVDNCSRENKNRFFLSYFELLVATGVFKEVQVSFLPVGHTHEDIDQVFSRVAHRLRISEAHTMPELHRQMENSFTPKPHTAEMLSVNNFSGLCDASKCIGKIGQFTQFRYFKFFRSSTEVTTEFKNAGQNRKAYRTTCMVKVQCDAEWGSLPDRNGKGFLDVVPNLEDVPEYELSAPDNVVEINRCINAAEERIRDTEKIAQLRALRDRVYRDRTESPHWDLSNSVELHGDYSLGCQEQNENTHEDAHESSLHPLSSFEYSPSDFVAVATEDSCPFWIGQVLNVSHRNEQNIVTHLNIRWYEPNAAARDSFLAKYRPSFLPNGGEGLPWQDEIHVDTVLLRFSSLSTDGALRANDAKALRQSTSIA